MVEKFKGPTLNEAGRSDYGKSFIKAWIKALRSGIYRQGYNTICITNNKPDNNVINSNPAYSSYCCLGVFSHVFQEQPRSTVDPGLDYIPVGGVPPVIRLLFNNYLCFVDMNDSNKFTFNEIADYLEYLLDGNKNKG